MKIKKVLSVLLTLCLFVNVSFAFDPYADEEVEKKSYKKLYYGIALTLLGGFLAYDGFSLEKVDVSKPSVDFLSVSHSEWVQITSTFIGTGEKQTRYELRSGISLNDVEGAPGDYKKYEIVYEDNPSEGGIYTIEPNILYNNGNVALRNLTIEVRYVYTPRNSIEKIYIGPDGYIMDEDGNYYNEKKKCYEQVANQGYHIAETNSSYGSNSQPVEDKKYGGDEEHYISLEKGDFVPWQDIWEYTTIMTNQPNGAERRPYSNDSGSNKANDESNNDESSDDDQEEPQDDKTGTIGLHLGKDTPTLMEVRVKLEKNKQYTPIYETRHKSDLEGVAGVFIGIAGIYFIIDHFFDMHKFNAYAKRHHLNLRVATASNQYKLMLQKRI